MLRSAEIFATLSGAMATKPAKKNLIRAYREANHLSQQEVADKLGVSRQLVGFLESGERSFTMDLALRMEAKLGILREDVFPEFFRRTAA